MDELRDLVASISELSYNEWGDAILIALATHTDPRARNLVTELTDAEVVEIRSRTPDGHILLVQCLIDSALTPSPATLSPKMNALRAQLESLFAEKEVLDR